MSKPRQELTPTAFQSEDEDEGVLTSVSNTPGGDLKRKQLKEAPEVLETDPAPDLDEYLKQLESSEAHKFMPTVPDTNSYSDDEEQEEATTTSATERITKLLNNNKQLKSIPNHELVNYPIYKKLYSPHPAIARLTKDEIENIRESHSISLKSPISPITSWAQLGMPKQISDILNSFTFDKPTPIQSEALPHLMSGKDFIGIAKTGSGKTLAYLLPMFRFLLANPLQRDVKYFGSTPRAIVLTPTRELAIQVSNEANKFASLLNLRVCCAYGGQLISSQIAELRTMAIDVVVGTPGRLMDLLCANSGKILKLTNVGYIVVDEADRMFDMGFGPQMKRILQESGIRSNAQKVCFSATFPKKVELEVNKIVNGVICKVGDRNGISEDIKQIVNVISTTNKIGQQGYQTEIKDKKMSLLLNVLGRWENVDTMSKCIIFTERQDDADKLVRMLLKRGHVALSLHGGKDQGERDGVIKDFQKGLIRIVVATSVAARGLDVEGLDLVINYDAPNHIEDYVHRVGRTGRAGKKGTAVTFVKEDETLFAWTLVKILNIGKEQVSKPEPDNFKSTTTNASGNQIDNKLYLLAEMWEKEKSENNTNKKNSGSGFGGHGLEKLDEARLEKATQERQIYLETPGASANEKTSQQRSEELGLKVTYEDGSANVEINDLPQDTRWAVSKADTLSELELAFEITVNVRGRYINNTKSTEEKLHLYIQGNQESIQLAVSWIEKKVIESLEHSQK